MPQNIPVPEQAADNINITLGDSSYNIIFRFNSREKYDNQGRWYFDLYTESGTPVKIGVKVIENQNLLSRYKLENLSGTIVCLQTALGSDSLITRNNLGIDKEYELVYFTQEELDEIEA